MRFTATNGMQYDVRWRKEHVAYDSRVGTFVKIPQEMINSNIAMRSIRTHCRISKVQPDGTYIPVSDASVTRNLLDPPCKVKGFKYSLKNALEKVGLNRNSRTNAWRAFTEEFIAGKSKSKVNA